MLYRFKSQAAADVIMLEVNARQILDIVGKSNEPRGIITTEQIPAAIAALESAIAREAEQSRHNKDPFAMEGHDAEAEREHVGLYQRASPLLHMLKLSQAEGRDVVWGV